MIVPEVTNYLQMPPGSCSKFYLILACEANTHIKALLTGLCSFIKPHMQNPHPPPSYHFITKMLLKNISSIITMVISTNIFKFHFSILVSVILRNADWCDIPQNKEQHTTLCCILNTWISFFLCFGIHTWHRILLHCISQCLLSQVSSLFRWLVDGARLPCLAVKHTKRGTVLIDVACLCLSYNTLTPCKPVDYRYSRLAVCNVSPL
jgi:hypothetical protein